MSSSNKLKIPFQEIMSATNNFSEKNKIGEGGFGRVYLGQSRRHDGLLAIKRLIPSGGHGDHEFGMEVELLSNYKHENLVTLIGFCVEGDEKILVYKYEANQSLDKSLCSKDLYWRVRLYICIGAARGLRYLHSEIGPGHVVIHRDIKSSNILLDENWNAKISDFGLSKIALTNSPDSGRFSVACGTQGYYDPQILHGVITQKSDVYSFGVVLYEVLFGKLVVSDQDNPPDGRFTVKMAKKHHEDMTLHLMIDPDLRKQINPNSLSTFSTIAYQCLNDVRETRPTMNMVVEALEKAWGYEHGFNTRNSIGSSSSGYMYDVYISFSAGSEFIVLQYVLDALQREELSFYGSCINSSCDCNARSSIKQSRSFIIIFTKNFDDDYCNLEDLAEIVACVKERGNIIVMPLFWDVLPSEVKMQNGYISKAMSVFNSQGLWKDALIEINYAYGVDKSVFDRYSQSLAREAVGRIKYQLSGGERECKMK